MNRAVIFSGGSIQNYDEVSSYILEGDFIICADSGVYHCQRLGLNADLWVGDFDSSDYKEALKLDAVKNAEIIRLNPVKDVTDTEYAIDTALQYGYKNIVVFAGTGTRLDHTLSNVFLMEKYVDNDAQIKIISENNVISLLKNSTITITKSRMKYVSVLPLENVYVSNKGFLYPIENEKMCRNSSRGISNELTSQSGYITVLGGCALIIESRD